MRAIRLAVAVAAVMSAAISAYAGISRRRARIKPDDAGTGLVEESGCGNPTRPSGAATFDGDYRHMLRFSSVSSMGELAGSLAHELNQPLTAIVSNAQAAREYLDAGTPDKTEMREILEDIARDAYRASATVIRIRALIKGEAMQVQPFDVAACIDEVIALVQGNAQGRGIRISRRTDPSLSCVNGDPIQVQQVLLNLLLNAFDATEAAQSAGPRRPEVAVLAELRQDLVQVSVCDRGCGVADAELERIFLPFVSTKPEGMGLGLAISRAVIERHGGHLHGWNNEDGGMTFRFSLPQEGPRSTAQFPAAQ